ncbi:Cerato-platanin-domain-containing protein [Abortiporus biennis]|nr:Cerato-platanin-domain-containing protein [Abortiporus biennis]
MRFTSVLVALSLLVSSVWSAPAVSTATTADVRYDQVYDGASNSLAIVACSDGSNGLLTKGYTTFGSLKNFPNIGSAQAIAGWNSANCGTCWKLTYQGKSVNVLAIDHAGDGFVLSLEAMNTLTNGHAEEYGIVTATVTQLSPSSCGL